MIQISITNFKNIIETKTYEFAKGELIHLTGKSGVGKSTILCAFEWGLYGKLGGIKPRSRKDLVPKVEINTNQISIDRDGPDLNVITEKGTKLTSDAAQGHILSIFGDCDLWKSCSYLEQGFRNKLLIGSGEEKMKILRDLTYGYGIGQENDPEYYLTKLQEHIKSANSAKKNSQAIYESFNEEAEKSMLEYEKSNNQWEESDFNTIGELRSKIKTLTEEYKKTSDFWVKQNMLIKERENIRSRLEKLESENKNVITDSEYHSKIEKINRDIIELKNDQQFLDLCSKIKGYLPYKVYKGSELENLLVQKASRKRYVDLLTSCGLSSNTTMKDLIEFKDQIEFQELEELRKFSEDMKFYYNEQNVELEGLKKKLGRKKFDEVAYNKSKDIMVSLKKSLTNFRKKKSYTCPGCKTKLFMNEKESLDLLEDLDVVKIEEQISKEQSKIDSFEEIKDLISKIQVAESDLNTVEADLESAEKNFNSIRYSELKEMKSLAVSGLLPKITKSIDQLIENFVEEIDQNLMKEYQNSDHLEKILGSKFDDFVANESKYTDHKNSTNINDLMKKYEKSKSDLEKQRKDSLVRSSEISMLTKKLRDLEGPERGPDEGPERGPGPKGLESLEKELEDLRRTEIDYIRFDEIQKKISILEKYEREALASVEKLRKLEVLYENFKKLSVQPIEDIINCINLRVNEILDRLFTDVPIQIMLSLYRQSAGPKKDSFTKIVVNLQVYHGNNNYPNISCLSGGEADRVSLALTLALAEIFRPPIVMLDECMASLDSELRETCLGIIKSSVTLTGSVYIDICHENIEGYYDDVIHVH